MGFAFAMDLYCIYPLVLPKKAFPPLIYKATIDIHDANHPTPHTPKADTRELTNSNATLNTPKQTTSRQKSIAKGLKSSPP